MMKKLRWAMDGEFWEVDLSTAVTLDGVARAGGDGVPLPLGLSRGARLSRPKQIDFLQRFMAVPLVPTFCDGIGLSLQRLISLPLPGGDAWFATLLGQLNVQRLVSSTLRRRRSGVAQEDSFLQSVWRQFSDPKFYAFNLCSEWLLTPQDTLLFSSEIDAGNKIPRNKAVLHHKFPNHNLTLEASSPSLFVDNLGNYWDVPFTLAMDLASAAPSTGGASCHFCINHNSGSPQQHQQGKGHSVPPPPTSLLPGLSAKCAVSLNENFYIWRSEAPKARMVQPYDILLSNPHVSASAVLGALVTASLPLADKDKHNSISITEDMNRNRNMISLCAKGALVSADLFASASLSAQLGNFQKLFFDLTRFHARLDIPSGSKFLNGASEVALALYNSQPPTVEALQAITPSATLSFQQQIAGPFSFRMDAGVSLDLKKDRERDGRAYLNVNDPVFAVEYALQVLCSAKAVAWYSPKQREFMIELRFFET